MNILNRIREVRCSQNISQEQLSCAIGVDRSTVAKWETGKAYPRGETLGKLADVLGCTIDALYGREPPDGHDPAEQESA